MNRKVIQITSALDSDGDAILHALCDDGTIWERYFIIGGGLRWRQIEDVDELLNVDTEEKAISFAKDWNKSAKDKLDAVAKNQDGIWYGFTGNVKLGKDEDGEKWECDNKFCRLNTLVRKKKEKENGITKNWKESLIIIEETSK